MRTKWILIGAALAAAPATSGARLAPEAVETIALGDQLPRWSRLQPGTRSYLRYRTEDGRRIAMDIWTRTVAVEPDSQGVQRLHIVQDWNGASLPFDRHVDSWFELGTFRPLTHLSKRTASGKESVAAVRFGRGEVVGDPAVADNAQAQLKVASLVPTFNFETDMELLSTLPWRSGYAARINFYHPGGDPPEYYVYRVTGSEAVHVGGRELDAWVVAIDYGKLGSAKFWIDKKSQAVLKVATIGPDIKGVLYKILLPDEAV